MTNSNDEVSAAMKFFHPLLLLAITLIIPAMTSASDATWKLEKEGERIRVYTRSVEGSPFHAVKAIAILNAPVENVIAALGDGSACSEWRAMCKSSRVLREVSERERIVYQVLDLPWPIADRDLVIYSTTEIDADSNSATVYFAPDTTTVASEDYVRAVSTGQFDIKVLSDQQVEFTYMMHADLGGDLSPGLINSQLISATYKDMKKLRALVEK